MNSKITLLGLAVLFVGGTGTTLAQFRPEPQGSGPKLPTPTVFPAHGGDHFCGRLAEKSLQMFRTAEGQQGLCDTTSNFISNCFYRTPGRARCHIAS